MEKIKIEQDGKTVDVEAVNVGGNNFIKLRDMEKLAPVTVGYNAKSGRPTVIAR